MTEREERHDQGDIYLWTCIDKKTKLLPSFLIGKRSADNARRFMMDVARRLVFPKPHASDAHHFARKDTQPSCSYRPMVRCLSRGRGLGVWSLCPLRHDHKGIQKRQHDLHAV